MNTFTKITGQAGGNYCEKHLVSNDYYNEQEQVQGEFYGSLQKEFNINNELSLEQKKEIFDKLYNNINPLTNDRLTQRELKNRGYDLTLSAPKSISLMYKLGEDERIKEAFRTSLEKTLKHIEDNHLYCRDRAGENYNSEATVKTSNMLAEVYTHENSRSLDPQLHAHAFIFNFTKNPENGKFKAIDHFEITKKLKDSSRFFENELCREIQKLGYKTELTYDLKGDVKSFEISGFKQETLDRFSERSKNIKEVKAEFYKKNGRPPTHEELQVIKLETRDKKLIKTNSADILKDQFSRLDKSEKKEISNLKGKSLKESRYIKDIAGREKEAVNYSLEHLTERKSVLTIDELKNECLKNFCGNVDYKKLDEVISKNNDIVFLTDNKITTIQARKEEIKAVEFVNKTKNKCKSINENFVAFSDKKSIYNETFKGHDYKEQRQAVKEILTSKDQTLIFRGVAGSGKTTTLAELEKGISNSGTKNFYFAPSTTAVNELKKDVSPNAKTVANLITRYEKGLFDNPTSENNKINNSVIVIDESGLISAKQGHKIIEIADKYNCRLILAGDTLQHKSVERGDFQRVLEENSSIKKVEITQIRRQQTENLREIARDFSKGNMIEGLNKLDEQGRIKECGNDYIRNGVKRYMELTDNGRNIDNTLIVASTNKEVDLISREVRFKRYKSGVLDKETEITKQIYKSCNRTEAQRKNINSYHVGETINFVQKCGSNEKNTSSTIKSVDKEKNVLRLSNGKKLSVEKTADKFDVGKEKEIKIAVGDQLRITANERGKNLVNGDIVKVVKIDNERKEILTDKNHKIDIESWKYIDYGYADTSHKAQGKGKDNVLNISRKSGRDQSYVDYTRTKKTYECYTADKERFFKSVQNAKNRESVHDLINKSKDRDIEKQQIMDRKKEQIKENKLKPDRKKEFKENYLKETSKNRYYELKDNSEKTIDHKKNVEKQIAGREKKKSIEQKIEPQKHITRARNFRERRQQQEMTTQIEKKRGIKKSHKIDHSRGMDIGF